MNSTLWKSSEWLWMSQFVKFCLVGGSGVIVDMAVLYLLADPKMLHWSVTPAKICSAEVAMLNNFLWNEVWTFRGTVEARVNGGLLSRLLGFHGICGIGLVLAVFFLNIFHTWLGFNLYISNFVAILLVTLWNFGMNARFNWRVAPHNGN
jgi:dolichol-phosphate mannosyltransferase